MQIAVAAEIAKNERTARLGFHLFAVALSIKVALNFQDHLNGKSTKEESDRIFNPDLLSDMLALNHVIDVKYREKTSKSSSNEVELKESNCIVF